MKLQLTLTPNGRFDNFLRKKGLNLQSEKLLKPAIIVALVGWFPLFVLSVITGTAFGGVPIPFLMDFPPTARFLVATPLLIVIQHLISKRVRIGAEQFVIRGIITEKTLPQYEHIIERVTNFRDSTISDIVILLLAYLGAYTALKTGLPDQSSTWYITITPEDKTITLAGYWYLLISTPMYQFLIFRWIWKYILWSYFLFKTSRLDLNLIPTHPDACGGLGFLPFVQRIFGIFVFIMSLMLASTFASSIIYEDASFLDQKFTILGLLVIVIILFTFPLFFYCGVLIKARRRGLIKYGMLATDYNRAFERKWVDGENPEHEPILGTGDIQSLADLGNSYGFIERMKPVPIDRETFIALIVPGLAPMVPLLLYEVPVVEIFEILRGVVL